MRYTADTDHELQSLLLRRRAVHCRSEGASLSKLIKKMLRKHVRQKQNLKTEMILKEFQDLGRLDALHRDPVRSRSQARGARLATLTRRQSHLQSLWRTFSIRMLVLARSTFSRC